MYEYSILYDSLYILHIREFIYDKGVHVRAHMHPCWTSEKQQYDKTCIKIRKQTERASFFVQAAILQILPSARTARVDARARITYNSIYEATIGEAMNMIDNYVCE